MRMLKTEAEVHRGSPEALLDIKIQICVDDDEIYIYYDGGPLLIRFKLRREHDMMTK